MTPLSNVQISQIFKAANAKLAAGKLDEAKEDFHRVHAAADKLPEPLFHLGRIARLQGDLRAAREFLTQAHERKRDEPAILQLLAECRELSGDTGGAAACHDRLIALHPGQPKPLADKALFLQQQGDFEAAEPLFKKALRRAPGSGELYRMWMGGKKLAKGDPNIRKMQQLFRDPRMNDIGKMHLGFALAKAMEDTGAYDKVFSYLRTANRLQRKAYPNEPAARDAEVDAIIATSQKTGPQIESSFAPIVVTGMPRSGTTLVEQILGAHDGVQAGGELGISLRLAYSIFGTPPKITPLDAISDDRLRQFADGFAEKAAMRVNAKGARITDKSIQNHLILGHLNRALPSAGLVVVRRDPRDIALSIYKNYFANGTHRYSNDLGDIAKYIKSFDRIVTFWKSRVPVHEIAYEDLVTDPEGQARAMFDAVGLEWQPDVLDFYKRGGAVKTLSLAQVRKPIYKSSGGAWRKYEKDLAPFIEAWETE